MCCFSEHEQCPPSYDPDSFPKTPKVFPLLFKLIEPEAGPPFTRYNSSLHNALL